MDELNVKLGLDTSSYDDSINEALSTFAGFEKELNENKIGLSFEGLEEANKVFSDIRNTAIKELNSIQSKINTVNLNNIKLGIDESRLKAELDRATAVLNQTPEYSRNAYADALKDYNSAKAAFDNIQVKIEVNDAELNNLMGQFDNLIDDFKNNPLEFDFDSSKLSRFNEEINHILDGCKRTGEALDEVDEKTEKVARTSTRLNLMGRMMSQIKNTIASAINPLNIFRKAWNGIINQDNSRFGATFKLIGENLLNIVKPAIEQIAMWILRLIGYFNVFLKAVSGGKWDLFAKSQKSSAATAKNAKEINKQMAGFDEINDISESKSGGSDAGSAAAFTMPDIGLDPNITKKIEDFGKVCKDVFDWIGKNWNIIVIAFIGIAAAVLVFKLAFGGLGKVMSPVSTGFGKMLESFGKAAEIIAILGGLALVIHEITGLLEAFHDSGMSIGEVGALLGIVLGEIAIAFVALAAATKLMDWKGIAGAAVILGGLALVLNQVTNIIKTLAGLGDNLNNVMIAFSVIMAEILVLVAAFTAAAFVLGSNPLALIAILALAGSISLVLITMAATLPTILDACGKFINTIAPPIIEIIKTISNGIATIIYALGTTLPPIVRAIGTVFNTIFNGIAKIVDSVGNSITKVLNAINSIIKTIGDSISKIMNTAASLVERVLKAILNFINQLGPAVNNLVNNMISAVTKLINFLVSGIEYMVNRLVIDGVNGIINGINKIGKYVGFTIPTVGQFTIPRFVPKLNVGTNYVPQDTLAMIHKGEAVIPKEFNSQEYFGGSGNEETNRLLEQLIEVIDSKDYNPSIGVRDIGEAAVSYIQRRNRVTGRSVV